MAPLGGADQMTSARAPWFSPTASPLAGWTVPLLGGLRAAFQEDKGGHLKAPGDPGSGTHIASFMPLSIGQSSS